MDRKNEIMVELEKWLHFSNICISNDNIRGAYMWTSRINVEFSVQVKVQNGQNSFYYI